MRGRASEVARRVAVKEQDYVGVENAIRSGAAHATMKNRGEIAVFDAGKYFEAGLHNRRISRADERGEMEEELDEEADAEASGDLPLSPLPEFYTTTSKTKHYSRKDQQHQNHEARAYAEAHAQGALARKSTRGASIPSPGRRQMGSQTGAKIDSGRVPNAESLPSPPAIASTGRDRHCNAAPLPDFADDKSQSKSFNKPQPFSPSTRLASFLAKFKLSPSEKSKPRVQYDNVSTPSAPPSGPAVTPPKRFFSNAATLPPNGKPPSPHGRFLRALSSSSWHSNPSGGALKPLSHMHQHSSIAASTPVSPAGSDPYSPITQSASTTPTSRKNPRSRPRSHTSYHEGTSPGSKSSLPTTTEWRRDIDDSRAGRSLSTHLPFLRRKLRAYLMPEKSPKSNHYDNHQPVAYQQDRMMNHAHRHVETSNRVDKMRHRGTIHKVISAEPVDNRGAVDRTSSAAMPAPQQDRQQVFPHHKSNQIGETMRLSPMGCRTASDTTRPVAAATKDASRRRGDWRRHAEEVEDDIEVAERLLRVVKEHQSIHQTYSSNYKGNYRQNSMQQANGLVVENDGNSSRKGRKTTISPYSSPGRLVAYNSKQASKEEFSCPYDSDSSSDLFEIETLQAFSHVAGLYRPRDLPVYDTPTKSPLHIK